MTSRFGFQPPDERTRQERERQHEQEEMARQEKRRFAEYTDKAYEALREVAQDYAGVNHYESVSVGPALDITSDIPAWTVRIAPFSPTDSQFLTVRIIKKSFARYELTFEFADHVSISDKETFILAMHDLTQSSEDN